MYNNYTNRLIITYNNDSSLINYITTNEYGKKTQYETKDQYIQMLHACHKRVLRLAKRNEVLQSERL